MKLRKSNEKIEAIKRKRMGAGFFPLQDMAECMSSRGAKITRQTYRNKEVGATKFNTDEIEVLADVFGMSLRDAIHFFNDAD